MPTPANRTPLPTTAPAVPHRPEPSGPELSPEECAARLRAGDEAVFEAVFRAHYARLCDVARGYLRSQELAEDVVQELFLRLWRQHDRLDIVGSVEAYLFRAVRNASLSRLRRHRVEHRWKEQEAGQPFRTAATVEEQASENDLARTIARAIDDLPERCRLIFTLNRFHGFTYDQIATSLTLSRKTVETQMGRAIRALRRKLQDYHLP